jgi:hypothetical protein
MAYYLIMNMGSSGNSGGNFSNISFAIYLASTNGQSYSGYPGQTISWNIGGNTGAQGVPSALSCAGGATPLLASGSYNIQHNINGVLGTVGGSAFFDGSGGFAPPDMSASSSAGTSDFDRKPAAVTAVTPTVNADKTISVALTGGASPTSAPAQTSTYNILYSQNGGAFTGLQSSTSLPIVFSGLAPGNNYVFRAYATNSDGTGASADSASTFLPSGGKIYNGTAWVPTTTARIYNGTAWVPLTTAKIYNGTSWVNLN